MFWLPLPYVNFTIETRMSPEEVRAKLARIICPPSFLRNSRIFGLFLPHFNEAGTQYYEGQVFPDSFWMQRETLLLFQGCRLVVRGKVRNCGDGTSIKVRMYPKLVFLVLFLLGAVACSLAAFRDRAELIGMWSALAGIFFFVVWFPCVVHARAAYRDLKNLFERTELHSSPEGVQR